MADSFTPSLNLTKPEVGASFDSWGGKLNTDMDLLDAVFLSTGLGTSVGLHVGTGKTLNVEGSMQIADQTDTTKRAVLLATQIATATTHSYAFPNASGTLALATVMPTGTVLSGYYGTTAPAGFVLLIGRTIGDAASGATERANVDTLNLYTLFWTLGSTPTGGRGASAQADFDAHKPMPLPDHRGRTMAAIDRDGSTVLSGAGTSTNRGGILGQSTAAYGIPAIGVNVGAWYAGGSYTATGYTTGAQSISITTSGESHNTGGVQFGGGGVFADAHTHHVGGTTSGEALSVTINSFGASGATVASGTTAGTNAQPSITVDMIIAL